MIIDLKKNSGMAETGRKRFISVFFLAFEDCSLIKEKRLSPD